jgi:hypothetical protein
LYDIFIQGRKMNEINNSNETNGIKKDETIIVDSGMPRESVSICLEKCCNGGQRCPQD